MWKRPWRRYRHKTNHKHKYAGRSGWFSLCLCLRRISFSLGSFVYTLFQNGRHFSILLFTCKLPLVASFLKSRFKRIFPLNEATRANLQVNKIIINGGHFGITCACVDSENQALTFYCSSSFVNTETMFLSKLQQERRSTLLINSFFLIFSVFCCLAPGSSNVFLWILKYFSWTQMACRDMK